MSGPYCKTCFHWLQNVRGGLGECHDPSKLIYAQSGIQINDFPHTHPEYTCRNYRCPVQIREQINESYQKANPKNCPVMVQTVDGVKASACAFFMSDGKTCPRHGDTSQYAAAEKARNE